MSTNAGGVRLLRYGSLRGNVLGLETVSGRCVCVWGGGGEQHWSCGSGLGSQPLGCEFDPSLGCAVETLSKFHAHTCMHIRLRKHTSIHFGLRLAVHLKAGEPMGM